jgi:secreted PhoX family phosphatase
MWFGQGVVFFACTSGGHVNRGQIWKYTPSPVEGTAGEANQPGRLELFVEPNDGTLIENCDNLTVSPWGDLIVCEDGSGDQFLVGISPEGRIYKFGRNAVSDSELAGATFSPDGTTLFVNIQHDGLTLAITGPWEER